MNLHRTLRILTLVSMSAGVGAAGCSKRVDEPASSSFRPAQAAPLPPPPTTLEVTDVVVGSGRTAQPGDTVHVRYTGTLLNGVKFDSTADHGDEPFKFTLGQGEVIKGWDDGVAGMKVGGKRELRIPPDLGYGDQGSPPTIPPGAGLHFEVELVSID
jgi:FKBP-type peptidyl-prolyl cis-trans isomerase FkpA